MRTGFNWHSHVDNWPGTIARRGRFVLVLMGLLAVFAIAEQTLAQAALCTARAGAVPTTGGARPGPITQLLPQVSVETADAGEAAEAPAAAEVSVATAAVAPVALRIPALGVDAGIEVLGQSGGSMQNPSGPWVVAWYSYLGSPGVPGNTVMAGHVDYVGVGPAVFSGVGGLGAGSEIVVVGAGGELLVYAVEWVASYSIFELGEDAVAGIIGPTGGESLTLITCGGQWDAAAREYLSRIIVRATRVGSLSASAAAPVPAATEAGWHFQSGATAEIVEGAVNLRTGPSTGAEVVSELAMGTRLEVTGRAVEGDGYVWWPVQSAEGTRGFVAAPFLNCFKEETRPSPRDAPAAAADDGADGSELAVAADDGTAGPDDGGPTDDGTAGPTGAAPAATSRDGPPAALADTAAASRH